MEKSSTLVKRIPSLPFKEKYTIPPRGGFLFLLL